MSGPIRLWRVTGDSLDHFAPTEVEANAFRTANLSDYPDAVVQPVRIPPGKAGLCQFLNEWAGVA